MDNIFILKPYVTAFELKDAIDERLIKAKAITGCLLSQDYDLHESNHAIFNGAVWAIEGYLDEIEHLEDKLQHKYKNKYNNQESDRRSSNI